MYTHTGGTMKYESLVACRLSARALSFEWTLTTVTVYGPQGAICSYLNGACNILAAAQNLAENVR